MNNKLNAIQSLRGVAVSLVILSHALFRMKGRFSNEAFIDSLISLSGAFGVSLFFVISGFIMVYASRSLFGSTSGGRVFFLKRVARVVPLYFVVTAIEYILRLHKSDDLMLVPLMKSLVFLPYSVDVGTYSSPLLSQGWTLNYEMFFYFVFALCVFLPIQKAVKTFMAGFLALVIAGQLFLASDAFDATVYAEFYASPIQLLFVAGVAIGYVRSVVRFELPAIFKSDLVLFSSLVFVAATLIAAASVGAIYSVGALKTVLGIISVAIVFACACVADNGDAKWGKGILFLGDISYSAYLTHGFVIVAILKLLSFFSVQVLPLAFIVLAFLLSIAVAWGVYTRGELPLTRQARSLLLEDASREPR